MTHVALKEIAKITMGTAPPGESYNTSGDGMPMIAGAGDYGDVYPEPKKWTNSPLATAKPGDLIVCVRATIGDLNWADKPYCLGRGVAGIRAKNGKSNIRYLAYFIDSRKRELTRKGTGSTFPAIRRADLEDISVPLPSLKEQKRIAAILDKADAIRRKRQEALDLVDPLLQSTFMEVVGPGAPDYRNWAGRTIDTLASPENGSMRTGPFGSDLRHSEFVDSGVAVLGIDNAVQNKFAWDERRYITPEKYERLRRYTVFPSDVIITIMGTIGRSAVVPGDIPTAITTKHLASITLNRDVAEPEFVSNAIHRHPEILRQLGATQRGAIMSGLNLGIIKGLQLPTPPIDVQREFTAAVNRVRTLEDDLSARLDAAADLFNSLVQRAFRGEL